MSLYLGTSINTAGNTALKLIISAQNWSWFDCEALNEVLARLTNAIAL